MGIKSKIRNTLDTKKNMKYWYGYYYEHARVDNNIILLESFHGKNISDSPLVCAEEIGRIWPGRYKLYYATDRMEEHQQTVRDLGLDVELVDIFSKKYAKILATAGCIISNASLPIYFIRKEGQKYLQTWHGTPLKTLGKKMREGIESMYNVQHNFIQASHIMFPNEFTRDVMMRDYNLEGLYTGKVIMCGYPRNEIFLRPERADEVRSRYGLEDTTVYAYMPTWRGTSNHAIENEGYFAEVRRIFSRLDAEMKDDQVMYVNFHPIIGGRFSFDGYRHIRPFPKDANSYEFLNAADALITDYSSVFFDYSLTGKPVILFMYDYDKYMKERGTYFDIRELPFRKIYDTDEFCECVAQGTCLDDSYSDSEYAARFLCYDAGGNTEKLLRYVIEGTDTGLTVRDHSGNLDRNIRVISPPQVRTRTDFRTLSRAAADNNAVVLMYRKWFGNGVGQMLHDDFNDDFEYIITTDTPPRSHMTQLMKRLGSAKAKRHIHMNDVKRCFGDLDVDPKYIRHFGYAETGFNADISSAVRIGAAVLPSDDGKIRFEFTLPEGMRMKSLLLIDDSSAVVYSREAAAEETAGGCAEFDFRQPVEEFLVYNREFCTPAVLCEDSEGRDRMACFTDTVKAGEVRDAVNREKAGVYEFASGVFRLPADYKRVNIKSMLAREGDEAAEAVRSLNMERREKLMLLWPTMYSGSSQDIIRVMPVLREMMPDPLSAPGVFRGYHFDSEGFTVRAFLPGWSAAEVTGAELRFISRTETDIRQAEAEARDVRGGCMATLRYRFAGSAELHPLKWNCGFMVRFGGMDHFLRIRFESRFIRHTLKIRNVQSRLGNGYILYPYLGLHGILTLMYREETAYDTAAVRAKEAAAMAIHVLGRPLLRRNRPYLVYEKFSRTAQDNSFYFFRYCMEQLPEKERKKFLYVIDKESPDYQFVRQYEPRVIQFMSIRHMVYAMNARLLISTDSPPHLYAWQTKPSFVYSRVRRKPVYFLQHGVTAMKRVDNLFGMNGSNPMKYFVATSETEQRILVNDFGYAAENAPIVGFTRWDALEDRRDPSDRFILIMPTWRVWLEDVPDEEFTASDYYQSYYDLLTGSRFTEILERNDLRAVLYLHPKFAKYIDTFRAQMSERVELVAFGTRPLNDIMMRASMLVTDYSSVCWDMLYMDRPVVFYQFDVDKYLQAHGSYIDLRHDLPSPRVEDSGSLLDEIEKCVSDGFVIREEYEEQMKKFFSYRDRNNCERTYRFLKEHEK